MSDEMLKTLLFAQELEKHIERDRIVALGKHFHNQPFANVVAALAVWYGNQLGQTGASKETIGAHLAAFSLVASIEARRVLELENKNGLQ